MKEIKLPDKKQWAILPKKPFYDTIRVKILKLARFRTWCYISNQDTQESSKLGEFHFEKGLNFISFSPWDYTKEDNIFYTQVPILVGMGAKD